MEVNLLSRVLIFLVFIFTSSTGAKVSKIGFSKNDRLASLHLIQLLKDHKISHKDKREIKSLIKLTRDSKSTFNKYHKLLMTLKSIPIDFPKSCKKISINTLQNDLIQKRINRIIDYECEKLFLKNFLKIRNPNKQNVGEILPVLLNSKYSHPEYIIKVTKTILKTSFKKLIPQPSCPRCFN